MAAIVLLLGRVSAAGVPIDAFPDRLPPYRQLERWDAPPPMPWEQDFRTSVTIQVSHTPAGNVTMTGYMYASTTRQKKSRANLLVHATGAGAGLHAPLALVTDETAGTTTQITQAPPGPIGGEAKVKCTVSRKQDSSTQAVTSDNGTTFGGYTFLGSTFVAIYITVQPGQEPLGIFVDPFNNQLVGMMGKNSDGSQTIVSLGTDFSTVPSPGLPPTEFAVPTNLKCTPTSSDSTEHSVRTIAARAFAYVSASMHL